MTAPNQLSFLPEDYLASKAQARTNVICAGLFLVVMVGLGLVFTMSEGPLRSARERNAQVARQYADAAKPIEQFHQMQDKQRQVTQQAELTASLLERVPRSFLLAEVTNALPAGTSLVDFVLESRTRAAPAAPPVPKTQFEIKKAGLEGRGAYTEGKVVDVTMRITGLATTDVQVSDFMKALSQSRLLKDVNLLISDEFEHSKDKIRRFQIEMMLDPDADTDRLERREPRRTTAAMEVQPAVK